MSCRSAFLRFPCVSFSISEHGLLDRSYAKSAHTLFRRKCVVRKLLGSLQRVFPNYKLLGNDWLPFIDSRNIGICFFSWREPLDVTTDSGDVSVEHEPLRGTEKEKGRMQWKSTRANQVWAHQEKPWTQFLVRELNVFSCPFVHQNKNNWARLLQVWNIFWTTSGKSNTVWKITNLIEDQFAARKTFRSTVLLRIY